MISITPDLLWYNRLDGLEQDLRRVESLLEAELIELKPGFRGKLGGLLSDLLFELKALRDRAKTHKEPVHLWADLASLHRRSQKIIEAQLEFLGGIAMVWGVSEGWGRFDEGFAPLTEEWLNELRRRVGLDRPLSLIVGRGSILELEIGIVRIPFLDWDLWHLPLLGRAVGLLAATSEGRQKDRLDKVVDPIIQQVNRLFWNDVRQLPSDLVRMLPEIVEIGQGYQSATLDTEKELFRQNHQEPLNELSNQQRTYLYHLFADMFTTAILGPAYALAVFVLELDYYSPEQYSLEDPDQIEGRDMAPRFLPASSHRAAAILATLQAMDEEDPDQQRDYNSVIQRLETIWRAAIQSTGQQDSLDIIRQKFSVWHQDLYQNVIQRTVGILLKDTRETWRRTQDWYKALCGKRPKPGLFPTITELVGAIWLHRLDYPDQADSTLILANLILQGENQIVLPQGPGTSPSKMVIQARLDRFKHCWERLEKILKSGQISEGDRAAVAGRFYRLLSEQEYQREQCSFGLQGGGCTPRNMG